MFLRSTVLVLGLFGALTAAQFPAYSQQYMQRLGGAVDALALVVSDFDASAERLGLSREEALGQLRGTAFAEARQADMRVTFDRYERLRADLVVLERQGPFMRAYHLPWMTDRDLAKRALRAFEPALPLTFTSAVFAAFGFFAIAGSLGLFLRLTGTGRRRRALSA